MARLLFLSLVVLCLAAPAASALELKNVRPCFGPLGATRGEKTKCLPGDFLFITYDIEGLKLDEKTGKANYLTTLELLDDNNNVPFKKDTPSEILPQLGGNSMPGDLHIILPRTQAPGKYSVRLTVNDRIGKDVKAFVYPFEVIAPSFGFVGVTAPRVGFPGQNYVAGFALVDMALDGKKQPNVHIMMRVLDGTGKNVVTQPILSTLPKDLPEEIDLKKENFVPMQFPIYLNRTGTYLIEVIAEDKISKKSIQLRYPLTVLDVGGGR